jgi:methyl-accepting chemotaxis protein
MRLSIKAKQVLGVTSIVGLAIVMLSALFLTTMARVMLGESMARGELIAKAVFQRASAVVAGSREPASALRQDGGLRSILESSAFSQDVTYAAIVDVSGEAIVHNDLTLVGRKLLPCADLKALLDKGPIEQLRVIYSDQGQTLEIRLPLLLGSVQLGSIRIGVSMLLTRKELDDALGPAALTALAALVGATLVAMLLAQVLLRPIHMIRSGLTRLGQGEFGVRLDLPQHDEFGELGGSFNAVSAQLSADRTRLAGQKAKLESVVEHLEDAVAASRPRASCSSPIRPFAQHFPLSRSASASGTCCHLVTRTGPRLRPRWRAASRTARSRPVCPRRDQRTQTRLTRNRLASA